MILWRDVEEWTDSLRPKTVVFWRDLDSTADHYRTLGIRPDASMPAIKQAYRSLAQRYHPDAHRGASPSMAEETMKALNLAYSILRSPVMRESYDQSRVLHRAK